MKQTENEMNVSVPLEVIKASEIEPKEVKWLWYPYIPFGKVTLLQGDPGDGKSKLMLSIAALLSKGDPLPFTDTDETEPNVYSNMISKLPCVLDELSNGCVFRRIRKIFSYVFIDEIQDFAGYDLEVIKKLYEVGCNMTLVGDPRQTTYRTHYEEKYKKYAGGKIADFVQDNITGMNIDTTTLSTSHRNNQIICNFRIFGHCVQYTRSCITLRAV